MLSRVVFGPWTPDRYPIEVGDKGLLRAENAVPYGGAYRGFPGRNAIVVSGTAAAAARVRGTGFGTRSDGSPYHFAGTETKLLELQGTGLVDVTRVASDYALATDARWVFTQFGDLIVAAGGHGQKLQAFLMGTSTDFIAIDDASLGGTGTAPSAKYVHVFGNQIFAGNLSTDANAVQWSVLDNPNAWPTPGSAAALSGLSDLQTLAGGGTRINALKGYGDVGFILKDHSLWRAEFVGGDIMWSFRMVVPEIGLLVPEMCIQHAGVCLFYSEHGWKLWAGGPELDHIGEGVLDKWFRDDFDPNYPERISCAMDQDENYGVVLYPGAGHVGGEPNRMLLFHFPTKQFSVIENPGIEHVTDAFQPTAALTLESMTQVSIDTLSGSPDDPTTPKKVHLAGYVSTSHELQLFNGAGQEMTLETGDVNHATGSRATVLVVRPMVDVDAMYAARVAVGAADTRTEEPVFSDEQQQANDGECYFREDGRTHRYRLRVPEGAPEIKAWGLEVEWESDGSSR